MKIKLILKKIKWVTVYKILGKKVLKVIKYKIKKNTNGKLLFLFLV